MNSNTNITVKSIEELTSFRLYVNTPKYLKRLFVETFVDNTRYEFLGFVDRSNDVILREKFYNIRDDSGRFAPVIPS